MCQVPRTDLQNFKAIRLISLEVKINQVETMKENEAI